VLSESELSSKFCGAQRPGHFDGVLTIVMKLLNIVRPKASYFGEKDYQQVKLIEAMAKAFFIDSEIVALPTIRETDGLAMSSRNLNLTAADRALAPNLYKIISKARTPASAIEQLQNAGFKVDYVEDWNGRRLAAATLGSVRLIDNVAL